MHEKILIVSQSNEDLKLLSKIIASDQYAVTQTCFDDGLEKKILQNGFPLILADYDLIRDKVNFFYELQKGPSKACLIFYTEGIGSEEATQILQKGVYTIIPRPLLSERIHDAIVGGLENRKAYIGILGMMDELIEVNARLEKEKENLRERNQELRFINLLSQEISYDLNWDRILTRIIDIGLKETLDYSLFGILYRIGSRWDLALHLAEGTGIIEEKALKSQILSRFFSKEKIPVEEVALQLISPEGKPDKAVSYKFDRLEILPLSLAGKRLGYVFDIPQKTLQLDSDREKLMNTLANILSLSLKNAQEYHKLREAAVTDSLTGIYNRNGLFAFLKKEFHRAKRYDKALSLVMIDLDDFKSINDSMGHQAGDYVLRELAGILKGSIRQPDIVARYGGDEFAILLPETKTDEAEVIMDRVSSKIKEHTFEWGSGKIKARMSYGISNTDDLREKDDEEGLIRLADFRLYISKKP